VFTPNPPEAAPIEAAGASNETPCETFAPISDAMFESAVATLPSTDDVAVTDARLTESTDRTGPVARAAAASDACFANTLVNWNESAPPSARPPLVPPLTREPETPWLGLVYAPGPKVVAPDPAAGWVATVCWVASA
jgi:hypothetical protein